MKPSLVLLAVVVVSTPCPAFAQQAPDSAGLTVYRPLHGVGYHPFTRTAVPEDLEEHPQFGPGIRVNGRSETDPEGEDDLIELVVTRPLAAGDFAFMRSAPELSVWTTREKQTEVGFAGLSSTRLAFAGAQQITLWVEWTGTARENPSLSLIDVESNRVVDQIVFHVFGSLVVALGGEDQEPDPVDMNHGMFRLATSLYELGWDVLMRDEDDVDPDGSGSVYDEVVNAIQNRSVRELAIFGYSHGGGSTYDICELLYIRRRSIGTFSVNFTAYVDGIENDGTLDTDPEVRIPLASSYHVNHYQRASSQDVQQALRNGHGSLAAFAAGVLEGGPVVGSNPPPIGLAVESTAWGMQAPPL